MSPLLAGVIIEPDMPELSAAEVSHLAKLARIRLSAAETKEFSAKLPKILDLVDQLKSVTLSKDLPAEPATALEKLRADEVSGQRLGVERLAKLAPEWQNGQNVVPAVFSEAADE